jgi:transcriptional regulator with XRE-family HTH domain
MSRKKSTIDQKRLKKFGEQLFLLRKSTGMSQREFAKTIGISGNYVSYLENGLSAPSQTLIRSIKDQYLINLETVLSDDDYAGKTGDTLQNTVVNEVQLMYDDKVNREKSVLTLLNMAKEILHSKTEYAKALETNIHAFHSALKHDLEHDEFRKRLANLEKKHLGG